jgi:hypothetical protein
LIDIVVMQRRRFDAAAAERVIAALLELTAQSRGNAVKRRKGAPRYGSRDLESFRHDVFSCGGLGSSSRLEDLAIFLTRDFDRPDLGFALAEVHDFLAPTTSELTRAHLWGVAVDYDEGVEELQRIVTSSKTDRFVRMHAMDCLRELKLDRKRSRARCA